MYPPAPEQPAASPYTPAGVTGNTPNTNANPNYAPQPQMQQAFQQQSPGTATPPTGMENNSFLQNVAQQQPPQPLQGTMPTPAQKYIGQNMGVAPTTEQGYARGGPVASRQANNVQQHGRGNDTMLVHMTPKEVGGLQALARAHGGSLTTNPHTGLPEAGFLSSILPMVLGAILTPLTGGIINPMTAGALVGAGTGIVTGDLKQGLMAGLGAFGGASLAAGLGAAAGAGAGAGATSAVTPGASIGMIPGQTAAEALTQFGVPAASEAATTVASTAIPAAVPAAAAATSSVPGITEMGNAIGSFGSTGSAIPAAGNLANVTVPTITAPAAPSMMGNLLGPNLGAKADAFGKGFSDAAGRGLTGTATKPSMMKTGLAAMGAGMPILEAMQPTYKPYEPEEDNWNYEGPYKPQDRKPRFMEGTRDPSDSSEFSFFEDTNPYPGFVTSTGARPSGYADGGPVRFGNGGSASTGQITLSDDVAKNLAGLGIFSGGGTGTVNYAEAPASTVAMQVAQPSTGYRPGVDAEHNYNFARIEPQAASPFTYNKTGLGELTGFDTSKVSADNLAYMQSLANKYGFDFGLTGTGGTTGTTGTTGTGGTGGTGGGGTTIGGTGGGGTMTGGGTVTGTGTFTDPDDPINDFTGLQGLANGGMTLRDGAFIVDARTVSELGNGSSGAGQELLAKYGGVPIRGPGDGVSDSIRANIGGKQEARVARDEVKFDPEAVARLGGGKASVGAKKLYALMNKAHTARKSAKRGQDTGLRGAL